MNKERKYHRYAVVMGLVPPGVSVVRELGKRGVPVCGVTKKNDYEIGRHSRYIDRLVSYTSSDELLTRLIAFAEKEDEKPILMPMRDDYIFFISDYYEKLKDHFLVQASYNPDTINKIVDKKFFYQALDHCGVPYARTWYPETSSAIEDIIKSGAFPLIAKPRRIHEHMKLLRRNKVFYLDTPQALRTFATDFKKTLSDWLIQEIILGPSSNSYVQAGYVDQNGQVIASLTARKLKQLPEDFGVGVNIISQKNEEIESLSRKLLKAFKFQGLYETEFKRDQLDNTFKVMEINPRAPLWIGLAAKAGIDINFTAYCDLCGLPAETNRKIEKKPVLWSYREKTVIGLFEKLMGKKSRKGLASARIDLPTSIIRTGPIWDVSDPMPAFSLFLFYMNKIMRRIQMRKR